MSLQPASAAWLSCGHKGNGACLITGLSRSVPEKLFSRGAVSEGGTAPPLNDAAFVPQGVSRGALSSSSQLPSKGLSCSHPGASAHLGPIASMAGEPNTFKGGSEELSQRVASLSLSRDRRRLFGRSWQAAGSGCGLGGDTAEAKSQRGDPVMRLLTLRRLWTQAAPQLLMLSPRGPSATRAEPEGSGRQLLLKYCVLARSSGCRWGEARLIVLAGFEDDADKVACHDLAWSWKDCEVVRGSAFVRNPDSAFRGLVDMDEAGRVDISVKESVGAEGRVMGGGGSAVSTSGSCL
jgi:hypothetical protein